MLALKELIIKFKSTPKSQLRSHTLFIIFGTYSVLTVAAVTNIIAPIFSVFSLIWIGPSATIIWIAIVTFAVIKHQLFNMRIIATQLFIFVLWVFLLIRALLSVGKSEAIINGILFAIVITLGVFLIRSVIKEVETREKVEKLASDLKMANTRLQELDRQKSEFVSIASHQLKAPLTAIKGYASMLLDGSFGELSGVVRDVANRIFKSSQGMVNVVEDFLNITRIEQGRMGYDIGKTDLAIIVRDVLSELQSTISASGLDLEMNIPNTPVMVLADGGKIKQVVLNLIDNALKYTPKGSVHVALLRKEGKAIFSVRDSGIGISQSFAMRMFGKFNRAENGMRLHANGSGIGLYLAKEILKAHKGRIWAESEGEGKGSTFFVELPVCA